MDVDLVLQKAPIVAPEAPASLSSKPFAPFSSGGAGALLISVGAALHVLEEEDGISSDSARLALLSSPSLLPRLRRLLAKHPLGGEWATAESDLPLAAAVALLAHRALGQATPRLTSIGAMPIRPVGEAALRLARGVAGSLPALQHAEPVLQQLAS